jgi:hypothetical protein
VVLKTVQFLAVVLTALALVSSAALLAPMAIRPCRESDPDLHWTVRGDVLRSVHSSVMEYLIACGWLTALGKSVVQTPPRKRQRFHLSIWPFAAQTKGVPFLPRNLERITHRFTTTHCPPPFK